MIRLLVAYHLSWIRLKRETNYLNLVAESRTIRDNTRYRAVCLEDETVPSGGVKRTQYECCYTVLQPSDKARTTATFLSSERKSIAETSNLKCGRLSRIHYSLVGMGAAKACFKDRGQRSPTEGGLLRRETEGTLIYEPVNQAT